MKCVGGPKIILEPEMIADVTLQVPGRHAHLASVSSGLFSHGDILIQSAYRFQSVGLLEGNFSAVFNSFK
jgi:hypothetical protein